MGQKITVGIKTISFFTYPQDNHHNAFDDDYNWPARLDMLLDFPPAGRDEQLLNGWSRDDLSHNMFIKDQLAVHRHPVPMSTDAVRGKRGFSRGLHVWEINWTTGHRGTSAVVGVGTKSAPLNCAGYHPLVGGNAESWGWDIRQNVLYHDSGSKPVGPYPGFLNNNAGGRFTVPDAFLVILDMEEGTLSFMENGCYLGIAFRGLKDLTLYPMISAVWGHCEVTMKYIGGLDPEPLSLKELSRRTIRQQLQKSHYEKVDNLPLPTALKLYLVYK